MALSALLVCAAAACGAPYPNGTRAELVPAGKSVAIQQAQRTLHWVQAGDPAKPLVLFVHGTPGSWTGFSGYLSDAALQSSFHMIAVDRPGFGASSPGQLDVTLAGQARAISAVIPAGRPAIVVGHSLGGPIAVQIAIDFPDKVAGLVLVAGSFDPALEDPRWYNRLADSRLLRWAVPESMRHANDEVLALRGELEALAKRWAALTQPAILIQGMRDRLVYPANADFVEARLPPDQLSVQRVDGAGHFILWKQPERIAGAIRHMDRLVRPATVSPG